MSGGRRSMLGRGGRHDVRDRTGRGKPGCRAVAWRRLQAAHLALLHRRAQGGGAPDSPDVREETGLPVVSEVLDPRHAELVAGYVDMLQIGTRNMQNFALLREVGQLQRPVLLKRGMSATLKDLLLAAEYVMSRGNMQVVLCERGIRTFGGETRNTFDLAAIPWLKKETHLPVIADPRMRAGAAIWSPR